MHVARTTRIDTLKWSLLFGPQSLSLRSPNAEDSAWTVEKAREASQQEQAGRVGVQKGENEGDRKD